LNQISSCLYNNTEFIAPSTYTYTDKALTFSCITRAFPLFPRESGGDGGDTVDMLDQDASNIETWKRKHKEKLLNTLSMRLAYLTDLLNSIFDRLGLICENFAIYTSLTTEHLIESIFADITKKIGAAIDWISKIWKNIKDMINAVKNYINTQYEKATDGGSKTLGHFKKAIQDALTTLNGYLSDIMKNAGQYIEQVGELLNDLADKLYDIKQIMFTLRSLNAMISEIISATQQTFNQMSEATDNMLENINVVDKLSKGQFDFIAGTQKINKDFIGGAELSYSNNRSLRLDGLISLPKYGGAEVSLPVNKNLGLSKLKLGGLTS
jgi:uncharacterized protein YoxC